MSAPKERLLRAHQVLNWLGITKRDLQKWVKVGKVHRKVICTGQRGFYDRDEINEVVFGKKKIDLW